MSFREAKPAQEVNPPKSISFLRMATDTLSTSGIWSEDIQSIEERFAKFLNSHFLSDITLVIGQERKRVPAHKFILTSCSWEFYNVFNHIKLDKDELLIEDVSPDAFMEFLKYCYTNKVSLTDENAFDIHNLAKRFQMKHLLSVCEAHIRSNVSKKTCIQLYSKMYLQSDSELADKILSIIEAHFSYLIQDRSIMRCFVDLPLAALRQIASLDNLQCDEMELFDALMKWATHTCRKAKVPDIPINLRKILCDVFYMIRFPVMKIEWFLEILAKYPEMLSPNEISNISLTIRGDMKSCSRFSHTPRRNDMPMLQNSMKLEIMEGDFVPCYLDSLKIMPIPTSVMSTRIKGTVARVMIGFGFIAKKGQEINVVSCKFSDSLICETTTFGNRYKLSWDYDLIIVRFARRISVMSRRDQWYELCCTLDKNVVHLSSDSLASFGEIQLKDMTVKIGQYAIIPYLVFEKRENLTFQFSGGLFSSVKN